MTTSVRTYLLSLAVAMSVPTVLSAQVIPNPYFCFFLDSATTYNGQLVQPGSIISAYDNAGVLCGEFKVHTRGHYGYMPVYGDDINSTVDEGANNGELVSFRINGRAATGVGVSTWADRAERFLRLSANATIALTAIELPEDRAVRFNDTVQFDVVLRNDGNGLDFYGVSASADNPNFLTLPQTDTVYANPAQVKMVSFFIETPTFLGGGDTVISVDYSVYSINDPTKSIGGSLNLYFTITDVGDDNPLPLGFALHQNYPNPFNPSTTISFSLPEAMEARLEILNLLGQQVEVLDFGRLGSGDHSVQWDASAQASGVYFYRLLSGAFQQSRKMMLVK